MQLYLIKGCVELAGPQAKPWLVRLPAFRVGSRRERRTGRARDEILALLPALVDECDEFTMKELMANFNPGDEVQRRWAVEKAIWRMNR